MLLDDFLPGFDFTEVHSTSVNAAPETVFRAALEVTPAEISSVMRLLFFLRSLPGQCSLQDHVDLQKCMNGQVV